MANLTDAYATALADIATQAHGHAREAAAENLFAALKRRGHARLLPKIYRAYATRLDERRGRNGGVLRVSPSLPDEKREKLVARIAREHGRVPADIEVREDDTLIDGYRFESRELVIDASAKHALATLYQNCIRHA